MDKYEVTFKTWNKIATLYKEKFMDFDLYNDTYDLFCQLVNKANPSVLEIGCGPGNITRYLLAQRPDFTMTILDVAPNMIKIAQELNPTTYCLEMDCRNIDQLNEKYDAIITGFCMPYLSKEDCRKLIRDCSSLLETNGIGYFSLIEDLYEKSGFETGSSGDSAYIYYHEVKYLLEMLAENNFEQIELIRKYYPTKDGKNQTHLILIARKILA